MEIEIEQAYLNSMSDTQAAQLCEDLRKELVESVSKTGGHLASNLGVVEFTVALHRVFDTGRDRLVFDVGHQCYSHKILTGRRAAMQTLRSFGGIAGYPKPSESAHDAFIAGHASNSISVAVGMARARSLLGENYNVVALIGDGALTGGLSYEGLSDAGQSGQKLIVVLNDNGMSITKSVGGIAKHLAHQRLKPHYLNFKKWYRKLMALTAIGRGLYRFNHRIKTAVKHTLLPCSMFEDMGFTYLGPVDGHDVKNLTQVLRDAKRMDGPVLLHIKTVKGKGYPPAELCPDEFHGVSQYDVATGTPLHQPGRSFSSVFGMTLCGLADEDRRVCAITAAMQSGTGLDGFSGQFSDRFFDVGIAEGHAIAMAAGMAKQGMIPVFAVYSSFLQRGYDMLIHDVALQNLHVVFGVDRAGLVGEDGETHHGVFDVAYLDTVPGMTVFAPASFSELGSMTRRAVLECHGPVAVRYPRGGEGILYRGNAGSAGTVCLQVGDAITLLSYGVTVNDLLEVAQLLQAEGIRAEILKCNIITPIDIAPVLDSVKKTGRLLVVEECAAANCVGQRVAAELEQAGVRVEKLALCNLGNGIVTHGSVAQLRQSCGLDAAALYRKAKEICANG